MAATLSNIDEAGEDHRLRMGALTFAATIVLVVILASLGVPPVFRLLVFFPFLGSLNLAYQGLFKT